MASTVKYIFTEGIINKKNEIVLFSATAIALYGYDQGMMSLINTNYDYLDTMGIGGEDPLVGIIVSVYYLGCAVGAVLASLLADRAGRKPSIFASLALTALGNAFMFVAGLGYDKGAMTMMFLGRIIMGFGVGGIDAVIPVYSSELNSEGGRGEALAKEFQSNIFGLNMAFAINLAVTNGLGKDNQWGKTAQDQSDKFTANVSQPGEYLSLQCKSTLSCSSPSSTGYPKPLAGLFSTSEKMTPKQRWQTYTARTKVRANLTS